MSTRAVADFVSSLSYDRLPHEVTDKAVVAILDHIGDALAARGDRAVAAAGRVAARMGGSPEATILDTGLQAPCNVAAMVNAAMAGTLDVDDGAFRPLGHLTHAGRVVVPACLAVAECEKASGKALIESVVAAYEVTLRAAWAVRIWDTNAVTEFTGAYGAAAGAAKLLGLGRDKVEHALGIVEAHCPQHSRARFLRKAAMTKDAAGWGAMTGVTAALLAGAGFEGPATVFDLPEGKEPVGTLSSSWEMMLLYLKPYTSCRNNHGPVDAVLHLMRTHHLSAGDVRTVTVGVASSPAARTAYYRPATTWEAQFSMPYIVGAAMTDGDVGPDQIAEGRLSDPAILSQADKVQVVVDPEADTMWPGELPGRVALETRDGRVLRAWVPHPRGSPENPLSDAEISEKFHRLAGRAIGVREARNVERAIRNISALPDVGDLVARLTRPGV